jgi:hypothetical protein
MEANLSGAVLLSKANLGGANLSGAYLSRAELSGQNLREANLSRLRHLEMLTTPRESAKTGYLLVAGCGWNPEKVERLIKDDPKPSGCSVRILSEFKALIMTM